MTFFKHWHSDSTTYIVERDKLGHVAGEIEVVAFVYNISMQMHVVALNIIRRCVVARNISISFDNISGLQWKAKIIFSGSTTDVVLHVL